MSREAGLAVSPNTVHKWFNGMSRPREDTIRKIAKVLSVDEVWLALGRMPSPEAKANVQEAARASGGVLVLAGLIEMAGGKVTFAGKDEPGVSLWANMGGQRIGITVATLTERDGQCAFMVPEPAGEKIVAVAVRQDCAFTGCLDILDISTVQRQNLGGFSVVSAEVLDGNALKFASDDKPRAPITSVAALVE